MSTDNKIQGLCMTCKFNTSCPYAHDPKHPVRICEAYSTNGVQGLCMTCRNNTICPQARDSQHPVLYCEEFDDYIPPEQEDFSVSTSSIEVEKSDEEKKISENYKGLCVNCENRKNCTILKPSGGVWHCEEYS